MDNQIQKNKAIYLEISAKSLQKRFEFCTISFTTKIKAFKSGSVN
jgi:hypothetical protein